MVSSFRKEKVVLCIPTYKEKENVSRLIPKIIDVFESHKIDGFILIIDDNSPDGTQDVVRDFAKNDARVILFPRKEKQGLGTAYRAGFKRALKTEATIIFEMDADFSHDPEIIPVMVEKISHDGKDFVVGSRKVKGGNVVGWGIHRHLVSTGANLFTHLILRLKTKDCTSGFRAIRRDLLERIDFGKIDTEGYAFQIELLFICEKYFKTSIDEVPIIFRDRKYGKSKLGFGDIKEFFIQVLRLLFKGKDYRKRIIIRWP
ncbi:MAG: polyprenol monophosphomannose synthase [Candidatus Hodarchaeales archaeon]